jgi:hypothetical protein
VGIEEVTVVCIDIDSQVIKMMAIEEVTRRVNEVRVRRGLRYWAMV